MSVIKWEQGRYGGSDGFISNHKIKVAHIGWGTIRKPGRPWVLQTKIPGFTNERYFASKDEAEAAAERILASFVKFATPKED